MNKDRERIFTALSCWITYIETGSFSGMSREQHIQLGSVEDLPRLSDEQRNSIQELHELRSKVIRGEEI